MEQEQWKSTTGISIRPGERKLSKQLKGIKIETPENWDSSDKKWMDSAYLDEWVNAVQRWLVYKAIDLDSAEALRSLDSNLRGALLLLIIISQETKTRLILFSALSLYCAIF